MHRDRADGTRARLLVTFEQCEATSSPTSLSSFKPNGTWPSTRKFITFDDQLTMVARRERLFTPSSRIRPGLSPIRCSSTTVNLSFDRSITQLLHARANKLERRGENLHKIISPPSLAASTRTRVPVNGKYTLPWIPLHGDRATTRASSSLQSCLRLCYGSVVPDGRD